MKKLLIVLLTLAMVASVAFAEISFDGQGWGQWNVVEGKSGRDGNGDYDRGIARSTLGTYGTDNGIRLRWGITGVNDDKTAGAYYQLRLTEDFKDVSTPGNPLTVVTSASFGWVWWNPIKQFKLTLGRIDGARPFGVLWGLAPGDFANAGGWGGSGGDIFSGIDANHGPLVQIYPIDGLEIAAGVNITGNSSNQAYDDYAHTAAYVGYTIPGIGVAALGFYGNTGFPHRKVEADPSKGFDYNNSKLEFAFNLTAVESLTAQLGVKIPFASKGGEVTSAQDDFEVALAANFASADTFGVLAHLKTTFGNKFEVDDFGWGYSTVGEGGTYYEGPFYFGIELNPWYNLGIGKVGINLNVGFGTATKTYQDTAATGSPSKYELASDKNEYMVWEVTPYFEKDFAVGAFLVGFKLGAKNYTNSDVKDGNGLIKWAIPIGLGFNFF
jgi:hypothetical protein